MSLSRCLLSAAANGRRAATAASSRLLMDSRPCVTAGLTQTLTQSELRTTAPLTVCVREYSKKAAYKKNTLSSASSSSSASDSDREKKGSDSRKGKHGQTAFWRRKMRTHHCIIDTNKDGVVSWDDFEIIIKRFTDLGHLGAKETEAFVDALKHVWEEEWGASGDPYVFIGAEQFMSNMEYAVNNKQLRKKIGKSMPYFFDAVDYDKSGSISVDEFKLFYQCLGLSEEMATSTFNLIDKNGDGTLSRKEFCKYGRKFFLTENEANPSKMFWGPLQS